LISVGTPIPIPKRITNWIGRLSVTVVELYQSITVRIVAIVALPTTVV